ncbi:hypothetical protein PINS_up007563 [Pythium insidiosum]|nr:hypothetical protein PINS_up007563 [Pythium insidiosum]
MKSNNQDTHFVEIDTPRSNDDPLPKLKLEWRGLTLRAAIKNPKTKATDEKIILNDVNGYASPGELLVIMGPSGAGKSSLLDCISGRNRNAEGSITVNGQPWSKSMKRLASYVMQDDLFYQTITVREHLIFQARLRMGKTHTVEQQEKRVDVVMEELGLVKSRDTLIGGMTLRGISGGERKRLSFATEILTNPSLLFVDEPTSGLDSTMAETVVLQLQQLARDGRTVIATIHQPSSEIFALFDKLYLLSDGAPVYHGKASEAVSYFSSVGYECPPFLNPSDYLMRQLVVMDKTTDTAGVQRVESLKSEWKKHSQALKVDDSECAAALLLEDSNASSTPANAGFFSLQRFLALAARNAVRFGRDVVAFRASIAMSLFVSLLVGLIYLNQQLTQTAIQNFVGVLFFVIVNQTFAAADPTFVTVPLELPIVEREYRAGLFRLLEWYLAKNISELPLQILTPIVYFVPIYFLIGFGGGFGLYVSMQCVLILVTSAAIGLGYMVSCLCRRVDLAPTVGVVVILPMLLFGGLYVNARDTPVYFSWIPYISPVRFGFESLMKIFWSQVDQIPCDSTLETCVATTGEGVLRLYGMADGSKTKCILMLVAVNVLFRAIGFIGLWLNLKPKRTSKK